jgi:hypothetical protein
MKSLSKFIGIIALIALIGFSLASCNNGTTGQSGTANQGGYKTYTAYDEAGNAFILDRPSRNLQPFRSIRK